MTVNTSATGGYLDPAPLPAPWPLEDESLVDFLQAIVVGVSGVPGKFVRPRWQVEPPNLPPAGTDWLAFGIDGRKKDTYAYLRHISTLDVDGNEVGEDHMERHEELNIRFSFYGPHADSICSRVSDGFQVEQNRTLMFLNDMGLVETTAPIPLPSLVKERWLYRVDMNLVIRREIKRTYPVLTILSVHGKVQTDIGSPTFATPFNVLQE